MKSIVLGALATLALAAGTCQAQGFLEGTPLDNTPFDVRTWVPESRDQGSHLPVEPSRPQAPQVASFLLTNAASGRALDATRDGRVIQWPTHGQVNQRWRITKDRDGTYLIASAATGRVLDATRDGRVVQWAAHGQANQRWRISKTRDGTYLITNAASGRALDAARDGRVIHWPTHGQANQRWRIARAADR